MKTTVIVLLIIFVSHLSSAHAENYSSIGSFLSDISSMSEASCSNLGKLVEKYKAEGKMAEAELTRGVMRNLCECLPTQVKATRLTLSPDEFKTQISESDFWKRFRPRLVDKCAAEQFISFFSDGCEERFAKLKNSDKYCTCMLSKFKELTDRDIADIGVAAAEYIPLAAEAEKKGLPPPEQSLWMKRYFALETACKAEFAEDKNDVWVQEQLNEPYMRFLSKDECMIKTIKTLSACTNDSCIKNMGGVLGDCVTWASGDEKNFCKNFEEKYLQTYCYSGYLDDKRCMVLQVLYQVVCIPHKKSEVK